MKRRKFRDNLVLFELTDSWDDLYYELCNDYFDLEKFKGICVDTIKLFFDLRNDSSLDKLCVSVLLRYDLRRHEL